MTVTHCISRFEMFLIERKSSTDAQTEKNGCTYMNDEHENGQPNSSIELTRSERGKESMPFHHTRSIKSPHGIEDFEKRILDRTTIASSKSGKVHFDENTFWKVTEKKKQQTKVAGTNIIIWKEVRGSFENWLTLFLIRVSSSPKKKKRLKIEELLNFSLISQITVVTKQVGEVLWTTFVPLLVALLPSVFQWLAHTHTHTYTH